MGLSRYALSALCCCSLLLGEESLPFSEQASAEPAHILFVAQKGDIGEAIGRYRSYSKERGAHDFSLLRQLGKVVLSPTRATSEPEEFLLALYGAGIALDADLLPLLRNALSCRIPELEVVAVGLLAKLGHDEADELLVEAMSSPFISTRLEAAYHLAEKRHPDIVDLTETLMTKVIPELHPAFPPIFALAATKRGDAQLRRLLASPNLETRRAAVLAVADYGRDDFLPDIRKLAGHIEPLLQEVCAHALGMLKDTHSIPRLEAYTQSPNSNVRIAALQSLARMGRDEARIPLETLASQGDLFAISALGSIPDSEPTLVDLLDHDDVSVRINATLSLLLRRDHRALIRISDILIRDGRDLAFEPFFSPGGALPAIRVVASARQHLKKKPLLAEISTRIRESVLIEVAHLSPDDFLVLSDALLASQQNDLVPLLIHLLENLRTPEALARLQNGRLRAGAPLIRGYSTLALYRIDDEESLFNDNLHDWVADNCNAELIRLRPFVPIKDRRSLLPATYDLTPLETSRLLIESFEAIAEKQNLDAVDMLLEAMEKGHPSNRFALAGLLLKTAE